MGSLHLGVVVVSVDKGGMMGSVESYRRCAAQCLALSRKVGDPADRELLVTMAQRWLDLAHRRPEIGWREEPRQTGEDQRRDH
jgi:hypothetical protein